MLPGPLGVAGAVLGHEEDLLAFAVGLEGLAHDGLAAAVVVVPGVVEEVDAVVDGGVHDLDGFLLVLDGADVPAAQAEDGDADAGLAERPGGEALAVGRVANAGDAEGSAGRQGRVHEFAPVGSHDEVLSKRADLCEHLIIRKRKQLCGLFYSFRRYSPAGNIKP